MSQFLKQSTACTIMFGPFVDKADGVTLEVGAGIITSIDHATTGIFLSKNGGTAAIRHQGVTASTLDAYGMFKVTLDTTDTNTVGTLDVLMAEAATFLPVHKTFMVLPANVYDSLMGTDLLDINAAQWLGTAILAPGVAGTPDVNAKLIGGTAQTGNDNGADINAILLDTGTDGVQVAGIKAAALADLFDTDSGTTYASAVAGSVVKETADNAGGSALTEAGIADAVWDEAQTGHEAAGSFGELQWVGNDQEIAANQLLGKGASGNTLKTFNLTRDGDATEFNPKKRTSV